MRLRELDPQFVRREIRPCHVGADGCNMVSEHTEHEDYVPVDAIADADGLMYLCPKCFVARGSGIGVHSVLSWRLGRVPDGVQPGPGRWDFIGTGIDDLTFRAGSSSIKLLGGCDAHYFIENGVIRLDP